MLAMTLEHPTWLHRWPAGVKMAAMALAMVAFLPVTEPLAVAALVAGTGALYASLGAPALRRGWRLLRPLALVLAVIFAWHLVIAAPREGVVICLRILGLVALANLVTLTTRLDDMTAVLEWLMSPLRRAGLNTAAVSLALALVIRYIPVLTHKGSALMDAWRARSPRRAGFQIAVPLVLVALDDADHLAEALRARGGIGGIGGTGRTD
ncbi:MAG TPA: energy-coupling factor transporter transmembrane protein EcfT [Paracoccus sp.]|nr:energy-coupling factor transporter transmembrane protein EcfT [Paracoccus sp. (in: a-proteobacteria)]